jgi:hypothetical protein
VPRIIDWTAIAVVSTAAGLVLESNSASPLCADEACTAEDDEGTDCPNFYTSNVAVWIRVENVGDRQLYARAPHYRNFGAHLPRPGIAQAWYSPSSWDPSARDSEGRQWFAEGPWKGVCTCVGRIAFVRASSPPDNFAGTVWSTREEGGTGGTGSGDPRETCYTVEIDHYWYYPDTGEVEYRYTEGRRYCEGEYET